MNDFAAPIIQAFMQGQQMKRQTQQDVIAAQEREKEAKRYADSLKRMEQQDKLQLALARYQIEDRIREQIGSGSRTIPTMPGMQAQTMGPVAQQLMDASGSPRMPQPEMQAPDANQNPLDYTRSPEQLMRSSLEQIPELQQPANLPELLNNPQAAAAMQLGKEFNIPRASTPEQKMFDAGPFGQIDMSQFPSYEETRDRKNAEAISQAGIKGLEAGIKATAAAVANEPFNMAKDSRAMQRGLAVANIGATSNQSIADKRIASLEKISGASNRVRESQIAATVAGDKLRALTAIQMTVMREDGAMARTELVEQGKRDHNVALENLGNAKIDLAREKLAAAPGSDVDPDTLISLGEDFEKGTLNREQLNSMPTKLKNQMTIFLSKNKITPLTKLQNTAVGEFNFVVDFIKDAKQLAGEFNSDFIAGLPLTSAAKKMEELTARLERYARANQGVKGTLTDKDIERLRGVLPTSGWGAGKATANARRIALLEKSSRDSFNTTYNGLSSDARKQVIKRSGMVELFPSEAGNK